MAGAVEAGALRVAYRDYGPADGPVAILLHGFPYDVHAYAEVAPRLADAGCRVLVPYLRGYGPTSFLSDATPRSGEQAALGADLLALMDALRIGKAVVAGYDWGGRAACIVSALWPERVTGLVTGDGYNIQNIARANLPADAESEYRYWYQWYLHGARGAAGLEKDRDGFCRLLWRLWSPDWAFDEATFRRSAAAFANPDFVEVVVHSYRHRYGLVPGDPHYAAIEAQLAAQPHIAVPTVSLHGDSDGVAAPVRDDRVRKMFGPDFRAVHLPRVGHNIPQEAPAAFADAVLSLIR
jgi:pimeloyl-ACP methyl ester carboxylesterase